MFMFTLDRVLYNIMGNDFVGEQYKARLRKSAKMGRDGAKKIKHGEQSVCLTEYPCSQLDSRHINNIVLTNGKHDSNVKVFKKD